MSKQISPEERARLKEQQRGFTKPSIPNNSICKFMLYDISFSKNAMDKAAAAGRELSLIHDPFTFRFAITSYLKTEKDENEKTKSEWIELLDYSDTKNIQVLEPEINIGAYYVMQKYEVQNARLSAPKTEANAVQIYATILEVKFGIDYVDGLNILIKFAQENHVEVSFRDVGIESIDTPTWDTVLFQAYRNFGKKKNGDYYTDIKLYDKEFPLEPKVEILKGDISTAVFAKMMEIKESKQQKFDTPF